LLILFPSDGEPSYQNLPTWIYMVLL